MVHVILSYPPGMAVSGANSMVISGLSFRNTLVGTGWASSLLLCMNR